MTFMVFSSVYGLCNVSDNKSERVEVCRYLTESVMNE